MAHTVKGSAASFGFAELSRQAEAVQMAAEEERFDQLPELAKTLLAGIEQILS